MYSIDIVGQNEYAIDPTLTFSVSKVFRKKTPRKMFQKRRGNSNESGLKC